MGAARYTFTEPREFPFFFVRPREVRAYDDRVEIWKGEVLERTLDFEDAAELSWEEAGRKSAIVFLGPEVSKTPRKILLTIPCRERVHFDYLKAFYTAFWKENVHDSLGKVSWTQDLAEKLKELRVLKKRYDQGEITKEEYARLRQGLLVGL